MMNNKVQYLNKPIGTRYRHKISTDKFKPEIDMWLSVKDKLEEEYQNLISRLITLDKHEFQHNTDFAESLNLVHERDVNFSKTRKTWDKGLRSDPWQSKNLQIN